MRGTKGRHFRNPGGGRAAAGLLVFASLCGAQTYTISTFAGTGASGFSGDGGAANAAQIAIPAGIVIDKSGTLYVADQGNHRVRQIQSNGVISTYAGNGTAGYSGDGGKASSAQLNAPNGLALDGSGNLFIVDSGNQVVRKVTSAGTISTVAGNNVGGAGFAGDGLAATNATLNVPIGVAVNAAGDLFIADSGNNRIRKVTASGGIISTVVGTGLSGSQGDGGRATSAQLTTPRSVAFDAAGNLYIADSGNQRIRKVATDGTISTVAGNGKAAFSGDLGPATSASLNSPRGVAVDAAGNLFIADYSNSRIRKVAANGAITTIAGNGRFAYAGDGGPATSASLFFPLSVAFDAAGRLYVSDTQDSVVRLLTPDAGSGVRPVVASGGVIVPQGFGGGALFSPGSWIEIYGSNLADHSRAWAGSDFNGVNAPTQLDGVSVTVAGQSAFLSYISPGQIDVQIPTNIAAGDQPLRVSNFSGVSDPLNITVKTVQPSLFAPASFNIGGKQYVAAVFTDGVTFVLPAGAIPGVPSRPAKPGETITLYGMGFGAVTPDIPAGQIVQRINALNSPVQITFGSTAATLSYSGLAVSATGLYQFNVVTPAVAASDAVPLTYSLSGVAGSQPLFTAVQNATAQE